MGRTRTNRLTFFQKQSSRGYVYKPGDLVKVRINQIRPFSLTGLPIE